jgi:hypothetical protein
MKIPLEISTLYQDRADPFHRHFISCNSCLLSTFQISAFGCLVVCGLVVFLCSLLSSLRLPASGLWQGKNQAKLFLPFFSCISIGCGVKTPFVKSKRRPSEAT